MANVLVTGASGLLGAHFVTLLSKGHAVTGVDRNLGWGDVECPMICGELSDETFLEKTIHECGPDMIVHCAAMIDVDACETNPDAAHDTNVVLTRRLLEGAPAECLFVYMSSDAVFDGTRSFWSEQDTPKPVNVYARTKLEGEHLVAAAERHLIARTNFYGWSSGKKKTAGEWLYRALEGEQPITLFDDFFFTPIYVVDLVRRLEYLIDSGQTGVFHIAGAERMSKYAFGKSLANGAGLSMVNVRRGSIDEARMGVPRPKDMSLGSEKFELLSGLASPSSAEGIERFVRDRDLSLSDRFAAPPAVL